MIILRIATKFFEFMTIYFTFYNDTISDYLEIFILIINILLNAFRITD